jgi:hypothetical protein
LSYLTVQETFKNKQEAARKANSGTISSKDEEEDNDEASREFHLLVIKSKVLKALESLEMLNDVSNTYKIELS